MIRHLNRGIKRLGGWAFWLGFWAWMLRENFKRREARAWRGAWR